MNHWRLISWLAPGFAAKHMAEAERRKGELERLKRAQDLIAKKQNANAERISAIEAELKLLARGRLR